MTVLESHKAPTAENIGLHSSQTIISMLADVISAHGHRIAMKDSDSTLDYYTLDRTSSQLAALLADVKTAEDQFVGILLEPKTDYLVSIFAVLKAGLAYVPLDFEYPSERVQRILKTTDTRILISSQNLYKKHAQALNAAVNPTSVLLIDFDARTVSAPFRRRAMVSPGELLSFDDLDALPHTNRTGSEDLACAIFTSGSSGKPKAVALSHRVITNHVLGYQNLLSVSEADRLLLISSMSFSLSLTPIYLSLLLGGTIVLPVDSWRQNVGLVLQSISKDSITIIKTIPSYLHRIAKASDHSTALNSLRYVILSGEPMRTSFALDWKRRFPNQRIINSYGMTEVFSSSAYEVQEGLDGTTGTLPAGNVTHNNRLYVLDSNSRPCQSSQMGEVYLAGDSLLSGYIETGKLDQSPLIDLSVDGITETLFRTGDTGYLDADGKLILSGRSDLTLNIRGYRIDPEEVENICNEFPDVRLSCVVGKTVGGNEHLTCIVETASAQFNVVGLRQHLASRLPLYMVPTKYFVCESIPTLVSGKLDRQGAKEVSARELYLELRSDEKPVDEVEKFIWEIWSQRLSSCQFGIDDSFIDVGGDSLGFIDMLLEVERKFRVVLSDRMPVASPTIRHLAEAVRQELLLGRLARPTPISKVWIEGFRPFDSRDEIRWESMFEVEVRTVKEPYSLNCSQASHTASKSSGRYFFTFVRIEFADSINEQALCKALSAIILRHEMLRTVLSVEAKTQQALEIDVRGRIPFCTCTSDEDVNDVLRTLNSLPFDLSKWPLFRWVMVYQKERNSFQFIWQVSHLVLDLIGVDVITRELIDLYEGFVKDEEVHLPPVLISNKEYTRDLQSLEYPAEIIKEEHSRIEEYHQAMNHTFDRLSAMGFVDFDTQNEYLFPQRLPAETSAVAPLACYAAALADWLGRDALPFRIGTLGRKYDVFTPPLKYFRLVSQAVDHYLLVLQRQADDPVLGFRDQITSYIDRVNTFSLNIDKIVNLMNRDRIKKSQFGPTITAGPLRRLTLASNLEGTIRSIPRPLWGMSSFHGFGKEGVRIALHSFESEYATRLHVHIRGVNRRHSSRLIEILGLYFDKIGK